MKSDFILLLFIGRDDKIIRIVKIAGLQWKSSQWEWLRLCKAQSAFLSGKKLMWVQIITSDTGEKSNLGFVNFNSYSMLRAVTKVLIILTLHSTCKAYMIEKIMVQVIWWKRLAYVCWRITTPSLFMRQRRMGTLFLKILYGTEPWIMNRNHPHYQRSFYLSKPTESIPSQAHQLICEMVEINFSPVLLTVIEHIH